MIVKNYIGVNKYILLRFGLIQCLKTLKNKHLIYSIQFFVVEKKSCMKN